VNSDTVKNSLFEGAFLSQPLKKNDLSYLPVHRFWQHSNILVKSFICNFIYNFIISSSTEDNQYLLVASLSHMSLGQFLRPIAVV
jgi:hypothetical protein